MPDRRLPCLAASLAALALACDGPGIVPPDPIVIELSPKTAALQVGQSTQVQVTVSGIPRDFVRLTSRNEGVATAAGELVVGTGPGETWVVAGLNGTAYDSLRVQVTAPPVTCLMLSIAPVQATLSPGQALQYTDGPCGPWNRERSFRSSDPAVATVTADGLATALAPGRTVITAIAVLDTMLRATAILDVAAGGN
jgi:trimeric autotransporter adhesin